MSKQLPTDQIANELAAGSVFFGRRDHEMPPASAPATPPPRAPQLTKRRQQTEEPQAPGEPAGLPASEHANSRASTFASERAGHSSSKQSDTRVRPPAGELSSRPAFAASAAQASTHAEDEQQPGSTAAYDATLVEHIRKTVRNPGRQVSYVRLTADEKQLLTEFLFVYGQRSNLKTSETEVMRIGLSFLLADYEQNGAASLLVQVLDALRS